jgi:hypothetical protein
MIVRVLLYCLLGGLPLCIGALGAGHLVQFFVSGVVLATAFAPIAVFGPRTVTGQFGIIAPVLLIVTALCLWSESVLFIPESRANAVGVLADESVMFLVLAAVLASLARVCALYRPAEKPVIPRRVGAVLLLVVVCGVLYAAYYLLFGSITYEFFTKKYYPDAPAAVARLGGWFWLIQIARGVLMTAAVLPAIYTLRLKRWHAALAIGLLLWIAGGGALLLAPNSYMVPAQRVFHIMEIMAQNVALGVTAVLLLRPRPLSA